MIKTTDGYEPSYLADKYRLTEWSLVKYFITAALCIAICIINRVYN